MIDIENNYKVFGKVLKEIREQSCSAESFSWNNQFSRNQTHKVERGDNITIKTLLRFINALNISVEDYLDLVKKKLKEEEILSQKPNN